jgi:hypothetical protein
MNLNILTNEEMLGVSAEWLENPQIVAELSKDPLGSAVHSKLQGAHHSVAEQTRLGAAIDAKLIELSGRLQTLDFLHDRNARALHNLLAALAEATGDADRAALYGELRALLFPEALRIVTRPYIHEAGAIVGLEHRVTPDVLRVLESIRVGERTLADIYKEWVQAGKDLGKTLQERARVQASIRRNGTEVATSRARQVRVRWIRAVRLLLDSIELLPLSAAARQALLAPLVQSIRQAIQRRAGTGAPPVPGDDVEPGTGPGIEPGMTPGMGDELGDDADSLDAASLAAELAELDELADIDELEDLIEIAAIEADPSIA